MSQVVARRKFTEAMKITFIILAILAIAFFILSPATHNFSAKPSLPPRHVVKTEQEARSLAAPRAIEVLGTGSMQPYIPASADPIGVVAIAAVENAPYDTLKKGDLVIYRWNGKLVIHQIMARQGKGWIASGLNNSAYDGPRVNRETYHSRVVRVYVIAQPASGMAANTR